MDALEIEDNLFVAGDAKLHGDMFRLLAAAVCKVLEIFPFIEAARPRSKSGIQALCSLHIAIDKTKSLLQHCSDCSKLYLAITGESILIKFEKIKSALRESLRRVEGIVPEAIGYQIMEVVAQLDLAMFMLDGSEKQAGDEIISLLQKDRNLKSDSNDGEELELFHRAALKLGITSSRAALTERRALKKLLEKAQAEEDKRKECVISYLYNLMRKYSKLFRSDFADEVDSQGSAPCSPTELGLEEASSPYSNTNVFDGQLSKLRSLNFIQNGRKSLSISIPPEELRCPISLQIMYDPVIISSGQTYERVCIEKWFNDGHSTCPKTQQQLLHLSLTPNYCVKGLIASWCEQNGVLIPNRPPDPIDLNYWRLASSQGESIDSMSLSNTKCYKMVLKEENGAPQDLPQNVPKQTSFFYQDALEDEAERYRWLVAALSEDASIQNKTKIVEQIRYLLKDNEEARIFMGANGIVDLLVQFLSLAIQDEDERAQEAGAMALFNLSVSNNRNKQLLISSGLLAVLEQMISNSETYELATALYLNLSHLEEAKPIIGSSKAVCFLVQLLQDENTKSSICKHDALYTLYNLSTYLPNIPFLLSTGVVSYLHSFLALPSEGNNLSEKALAVIINLVSSQEGREEMVQTPCLVIALAGFLDIGEPVEQEQAVSCLLILCSSDDRCIQMVLQEGVVPSLVSISVDGTTRGKEKAQKLLKLFREQRQREPSMRQQQQLDIESNDGHPIIVESKVWCKTRSKKFGRALGSLWKNKNLSVYQC